ncbi:MAG: multicopper oxidase domain-containing protein [Actinobacteria bacterium]|nr:multicopper oxidase domain-containing protein [Actinomycetota bacterium]
MIRSTPEQAHGGHRFQVHCNTVGLFTGEPRSVRRSQGRYSRSSSGKDTVYVPPGQIVRLLIRFDGYRGRYAFHCHNLEHEDMIMANFEVV